MPRLRPCLLVSMVWALAVPAGARAQTPTALSWVRAAGAESCIGPQELAHAVERQVGPVLVAAPEGELNVEGHVERREDRFVARIVISDDEGAVLGDREVTAPGDDCRALDSQIAFVIAVAIDPDAALSELPGELTPVDDVDPGAELLQDLADDPPAPRQPPRRARPPAPSAAPAPPPTAAAPARHATLGLGAMAGAGVLEQGVSVGGRLEGTLELGHTWVLLDAALWGADTRTVGPQQAVELARWDAGLSACPLAGQLGATELAACAGVLMSRLTATPRGFAGQRVARLLWGPRLSGRVAYRWMPSLGVELRLDLSRSFPQHSIHYSALGQEQPIHRVADLTAGAVLGLFVRF